MLGGIGMKNREKFRDEILKSAVIQGRDLCDFKRKVVFSHFGKDGCTGISCAWCRMLTDLWFDEEYVEPEPQKPEVDWSKVPVDTLVRVRDLDDGEWTLRYFAGIDNEDSANRYAVWQDGATSKTAYRYTERWAYCELMEDENHE